MKVLVTGGREYSDRARVFQVLDDLHFGTGPDGGAGGTQRLISCVVHGAARGADLLSEDWARRREIQYRGYPARWREHGGWCHCAQPRGEFCKSAGAWRNQQMLDVEHVEAQPIALVVAFPGGVGTADMVRRARLAKIKRLEIRP